MLGRVMSARTGKMYLDLVNSKMPHASSVSAMAQSQMYEGAFRVSATARETAAEATAVPLDTLEQELWMYIDDAKSTPADPQLLQRDQERRRSRVPPEPGRHGHRRHAGPDGSRLPVAAHRGASTSSAWP